MISMNYTVKGYSWLDKVFLFIFNHMKSNANHYGLNVSDIVAFSRDLRTKCVLLVMFRPPLPLVRICMH